MTERERLPDDEQEPQGGARIYDAKGAQAEPQGGARMYEAGRRIDAELHKPIGGAAGGDPAEPRTDPNLGNILTMIIIAALVLVAVFGMIVFFSLR